MYIWYVLLHVHLLQFGLVMHKWSWPLINGQDHLCITRPVTKPQQLRNFRILFHKVWRWLILLFCYRNLQILSSWYSEFVLCLTSWRLIGSLCRHHLISRIMWKIPLFGSELFWKVLKTSNDTFYQLSVQLTHWGRVTHMCVTNLGHHLFN